MAARAMRPMLAGRRRDRLEALEEELGGRFDTAVADVSDPPSVRALVEEGDILVTTVGPFVRWGAPAAAAAATAGAHYLDSTGEPPFIREVFERYGPVAEKSGCAMLTAFGYDWVPGNLAAGIALQRAGEDAVRVDSGYFATGRGKISGGTAASLAGMVAERAFAYRDGKVRSERVAKRYRKFPVGTREWAAVSVGTSELFALPRIAPRLREVNTYLGWFGPASRALQAMSAASDAATKLPGATSLLEAVAARLAQAPGGGGPDEEARARIGSHVVAIAYDAGGRELSQVHVTGVDGYTFTGRILAWGAERAAAGGLRGTGALGPVDGFGLDELIAGCAEAGISEEGAPEAERPPAAEPPAEGQRPPAAEPTEAPESATAGG